MVLHQPLLPLYISIVPSMLSTVAGLPLDVSVHQQPVLSRELSSLQQFVLHLDVSVMSLCCTFACAFVLHMEVPVYSACATPVNDCLETILCEIFVVATSG
jgi:hypothetical protein